MPDIETQARERAAFVYMDATRFIAAALVALSHIRNMVLVDYNVIGAAGPAVKAFYVLSGFGHQAVMIFFVLSGFWIAGSVTRRAGEPRFWTSYLIDRLSRLMIVLVPALLLGAALDSFGAFVLRSPIYFGQSDMASMATDVTHSLTFPVFLANLVFLQTIFAPVFGSNGPLWSLAYEFWYYIWFPALWMLLRHRKFSFALVALAIAWFNPALMGGFLAWLSGAALRAAYEHARRHDWLGKKRALGGGLLVLGGVVLAGALGYSRFRPEASIVLDFLIAAPFALTLYGLCLLAPGWPRIANPISHYGAQASYSLYVIHFPVAAFIAASLLPGERSLPSLAGIGMVLGVLAAVIAIGYAFAMLTERNTGKLREKLRRAFLNR